MNAVVVLRIIACFCFFIAGVPYEPIKPWSGNIGWLGMFFFGLSFIIT